MSYSELRQHAQLIEELVVQRTLDQLGIARLPDERFVDKSNMSPVAAEVVAAIRDECAGISNIFEPFLNLPNPAALANMHNQLIEAAALLSTQNKSVDPVQKIEFPANAEMIRTVMVNEAMSSWSGLAAEKFKRGFLLKWPVVAVNQFTLISVLAGAIAAERALWEECQKNVDDIAHHVIAVLESMGRDTSVDGEVILLTVASSVLAVSAALTAGTTAVALTAVSAVAQVAGTVVDKSGGDSDAQVRFDAVSPLALVDQLRQALYKLQFIVLGKEQEIANALIGSAATVDALRESFVSPRPMLADQTTRTIMTERGLGDLL